MVLAFFAFCCCRVSDAPLMHVEKGVGRDCAFRIPLGLGRRWSERRRLQELTRRLLDTTPFGMGARRNYVLYLLCLGIAWTSLFVPAWLELTVMTRDSGVTKSKTSQAYEGPAEKFVAKKDLKVYYKLHADHPSP